MGLGGAAATISAAAEGEAAKAAIRQTGGTGKERRRGLRRARARVDATATLTLLLRERLRRDDESAD